MAYPIEGFSSADVIRQAISRAGLRAGTAEEIQDAQRSLFLVLQEWQARRLPTWRYDHLTIQSMMQAETLAISVEVDDIVSLQPSTGTTEGPWEPPIQRVSFAEFSEYRTPAEAGRPTLFYLQRGSAPVLHLYPPTTAGRWFRMACVVRPADWAGDGPGGDDAPPARWLPALIASVAYDLAQQSSDVPPQKMQQLAQRAEMLVRQAESNDRERTRFRVRFK